MTQTHFPVGTFTPNPRPAAVPKMLAAQFGLELKLLLRNGEQLLLTMFIPITLLIGLTLLPLGSFGDNRAATFVPVIMALAVISTAFTGQAIAVAFDRRYGALKRLGATALPVWGIIAGKSAAVVTVVFLQSIILGAIGFALGWRPPRRVWPWVRRSSRWAPRFSRRWACCLAAPCEQRSCWQWPTCCGLSSPDSVR